MDAAFAAGLDGIGAFPDKIKIEALQMLAEDAVGNPAAIATLADLALTKFALASSDRKISLFYVIDAIGKSRLMGPAFQEACGTRLVTTALNAASQVRHVWNRSTCACVRAR